MKNKLIFVALLFSQVFCGNFFYIKKEREYTVNTDKSGLAFFEVPLERNEKGRAKQVAIYTKLNSNLSQIKPVLIVSKERLPNTNVKSQILCENFALNKCTIPGKFIESSENQKVNIGVFCKNCNFNIQVDFEPKIKKNRKLSENMLLQTNKAPVLNANLNKLPDDEQLNFMMADGVSALIIGLLFVFVCYVASHTMMNIYVHKQKLVEEPLKLGRVEA